MTVPAASYPRPRRRTVRCGHHLRGSVGWELPHAVRRHCRSQRVRHAHAVAAIMQITGSDALTWFGIVSIEGRLGLYPPYAPREREESYL
jgi:hypothetical protein